MHVYPRRAGSPGRGMARIAIVTHRQESGLGRRGAPQPTSRPEKRRLGTTAASYFSFVQALRRSANQDTSLMPIQTGVSST
jgi:hypothetical protein